MNYKMKRRIVECLARSRIYKKYPIQTIRIYYTIYKEKKQEKTYRFAEFYLFFTKPLFSFFV